MKANFNRKNRFYLGSSIFVFCSIMFNSSLLAEPVDQNAQVKTNPNKVKKTPHHSAKAKHGGYNAALAEPADPKPAAVIAPPASPLAAFEKLRYKGWDIQFPHFEDSLVQDYGGVRSALASAGFGFTVLGLNIFENNLLSTPIKVPALSPSGVAYPPCQNTFVKTNSICAGNQVYNGERPLFFTGDPGYLTYDTSRWGVPDGQIAVIGGPVWNTSQNGYYPDTLRLGGLSWYQTAFDKRVEIKIGEVSNSQEFVGSSVGQNFASTFGPAGSIPTELGMSYGPPIATPSARITVHLTDALYNEFAVMRSLPVNGPTGNPLLDENTYNPSGVRFSVPGAKALYVDELGYKNAAAPGVMQNWLRFGAMYNQSSFTDFSKLGTGATISGNSGFYFLADRQLWQQAPSSPYTAYRGIYAGVSAMYAPPAETAISQYYEGRAYWVGPFDSRATDLVSIVYNHQVFSHYLADTIDIDYGSLYAAGFPVPSARHASNSITLTYLAHIMPGVYGSVGLGYTDHPSVEYFKGEGSALNLLSSLILVF